MTISYAEFVKTIAENESEELATPKDNATEIEAEQALVAANRELISRFEHKIQATLARIWGVEKIED